MRSAIALAVLTAGAILTFAVSAEVPGINLRLTGVIVILAGIAAMISPARAAAWLHLHPLPHGRPQPEPHDDDDDFGYSAYLLQDPAVLAAEVLKGAGVGQPGPGHGNHGPHSPRGPAEQAAYGNSGHDGHHGQS